MKANGNEYVYVYIKGFWKDRHAMTNDWGPQIKIIYYVPGKELLFKILVNILI